MAAPDSTGVGRRRARLDGNRRRTHPAPRLRRKPAYEPLEPIAGERVRDRQTQLADITRRLKVIGAFAVTAEIALKTQNCEQDADIAECLRHGVVDALTAQIERLDHLHGMASSWKFAVSELCDGAGIRPSNDQHVVNAEADRAELQTEIQLARDAKGSKL